MNRYKNWSNRYQSGFNSRTLEKDGAFNSSVASPSKADNLPGMAKDDPMAYLQKEDTIVAKEPYNPLKGEDVKNLPAHLFRPFNSESVDLRNLVELPAGDSFEILRFRCPKGTNIVFLGYGVFNDALLEQDVEFIPRVNGKRIFPFHGNPNNNFKISLGLAPDLSNAALIECYLQLRPDDLLTWTVVSTATVPTNVGVRMKGYIDATSLQTERKFGG